MQHQLGAQMCIYHNAEDCRAAEGDVAAVAAAAAINLLNPLNNIRST